jgi:voltage-gated potassium channel
MATNELKVESKELKDTGYEIFVGILSILSIANIVLQVLAEDPNLDTVLDIMNGLFSVIFLGDFIYRLFTAESFSFSPSAPSMLILQ